MFAIRIDLVEYRVSGLDALDLRRRLKLPDSSDATFRDVRLARCEVSEGFARAHFPRDSRQVDRDVTVGLLIPGDCVESGPGSQRCMATDIVLAELTPARIMELWLAAAAPASE